jgi:hypothetical protein
VLAKLALPQSEFLVAAIERLLTRVVDVVGADAHTRIRRDREHRLTKMQSDLEGTLADLTNPTASQITLRYVSQLELTCHLRLLERAKRELSGWEHLMASCVDGSFYDHFVLTLLVQEACREFWGLQAQIIPESETRTPDLMIYRGGEMLMAAEVKSKLKLKDPRGPFPFKDAQQIVKAAMRDIGSSTGGQLGHGLPGVLVIGGFFIDRMRMELLREAASNWFRQHPGRKKSLVGMLFVNFLAAATPEWSTAPPDQRTPIPRLDTGLDMRFAPNPGHTTDVNLTGWQPLRFTVNPEYDRWSPDIVLVKNPRQE